MIKDPWSEGIVRQLHRDVLLNCATQFREALVTLGSYSCQEVRQMKYALDSLEQEIERRELRHSSEETDGQSDDSFVAQGQQAQARRQNSTRPLDERLQSLEHSIENVLQENDGKADTSPNAPSDRSAEYSTLAHLDPLFKGLSTNVISLLNKEGVIRYQSKYVKTLLGYESAKLVGQKLNAIVHPLSRPTLQEGIARLVENREKCTEWKLKFKTADNSFCWLKGTASNLLNDPNVRGLIVLWTELVD